MEKRKVPISGHADQKGQFVWMPTQKEIDATEQYSSSIPAKQASSDIKGGIDFNAKNMNVSTTGDQINFNIPLDTQNIDFSNVQGFVPIIINIAPLTSFTGLLGLSKDDLSDQLVLK